MDENEIEKYVLQYGEIYRTMIISAISFKDKLVKNLKLTNFNTDIYIQDIIDHTNST